MPIYAYKCAECGHDLEVIQKVSDALLTDCPSCDRPALVKQVTAAGFQLKGGGWYVTDFRDSGRKKDGAKPDEKAKTDQASESRTDTKPDTKIDGATDSKGTAKTETKTDAKPESGSKPASAPPPAAPKAGTP
jgi:putative FmdB family regulatory protein